MGCSGFRRRLLAGVGSGVWVLAGGAGRARLLVELAGGAGG